MTRAVQRHAVGAEPGDAVIFRRFVEGIASGGLIEHCTHVAHTYVIGPGRRGIHPVDDIFAVLIVEMSVLHSFSLHFLIVIFSSDLPFRGRLGLHSTKWFLL